MVCISNHYLVVHESNAREVHTERWILAVVCERYHGLVQRKKFCFSLGLSNPSCSALFHIAIAGLFFLGSYFNTQLLLKNDSAFSTNHTQLLLMV